MKIATLFLTLFVLTSFTANSLQAEVYKWTDKDGHLHFGDRKPSNERVESVALHGINSYSHVSVELAPLNKPATANATQKNTIMYSTSWCGYCRQARAYFAAKGIPYTDYDIETDASAKQQYDQFGGHGVPVIFVGQARMNGFSAASFEQLYQQAK